MTTGDAYTIESERLIRRSATVAAGPEVVFDLLATPRRHAELDGSGTVRGVVFGPHRLYRGAEFGMRMKMGAPYRIRSTVIEFVEGQQIAWRHNMGHHIWRYELEPVPEGTRVIESFDYRRARSARVIELAGYHTRNTAGIEATLTRLQRLFS